MFVFEGADLLNIPTKLGEIGLPEDVAAAIEAQFHRTPQNLEIAYYAGAFYWVAWWKDEEYSIVDGQGRMLLTDDVERLRGALEATLRGTLLVTDEALAEAESRHLARLKVMNRLFRSETVNVPADAEDSDPVIALEAEPFTRVEDGHLSLVPAASLEAAEVARLFVSMFEGPVKVSLLSFMIERHHAPYGDRLVEVLPELQAGFALDEEDAATLREVAVLFPSVCPTIASKIAMITTHRSDQPEVTDESILASDRTRSGRSS